NAPPRALGARTGRAPSNTSIRSVSNARGNRSAARGSPPHRWPSAAHDARTWGYTQFRAPTPRLGQPTTHEPGHTPSSVRARPGWDGPRRTKLGIRPGPCTHSPAGAAHDARTWAYTQFRART